MSATAIHISGLAAGALHSKKLPIALSSDFSHSGVGGGGGGGGGKAVWISPPAIVWLYPGSTSSGSSSQPPPVSGLDGSAAVDAWALQRDIMLTSWTGPARSLPTFVQRDLTTK